MQTCPECGGRNEAGELFCGVCGTYLEWEEQPPPPPAPSPAPEPAPTADLSPTAQVSSDGVPEGDAPDEPGARPVATPEPVASGGPGPEAAAAAQSEPDADVRTEGGPRGGTPSWGAGVAGELGGRASRLVRRAADQATGGAASAAAGTSARTTSRVRSAARDPRRAVQAEAARAAGVTTGALGGTALPAAASAARPATRAPAEAQAVAEPGTAGTGRQAGGATAAPARKPAAPAPRQPAARKPGAPVPRRPVPQDAPDEPPPRPGDLICGACGVGNAPHRNFCRRCGASLADAPVQPQRSWWRRVLRPDPRPGPSAGTRPRYRRRRRFPTGLVVTLVILGLLAGGAYYFRDTLAGAYDAVVDRVAGDNPVVPDSGGASSSRQDRSHELAFDGVSDRSWAPQGSGEGEYVEFFFDDPFRLVAVIISGGNGLTEEERRLEARPKQVRLTYTTADGDSTTEVVDLIDTGDAQRVPVGASDVAQVRLTIVDVYEGGPEAPVALAEVDFRGRS